MTPLQVRFRERISAAIRIPRSGEDSPTRIRNFHSARTHALDMHEVHLQRVPPTGDDG